ncbi:MAG: hypothetical protein OEV49_00690 [candidate division Zixibacteria bacterium]|nr:hypothetical protein [candidate division Zixibacteria bacterium]MDH3936417.1 hypothetical protein [candidate division Zixibacteria bacterium]MDH4035093.1 hypothetical protein [candidate division Zixibacteria bacterium]
MEEIYPKQPFDDVHRFIGELKADEHTVDGLQIVAQYSLDKPGPIRIVIEGDSEVRKTLRTVLDKNPHSLSVKSTDKDEGGKRILMDDVWLKDWHSSEFPDFLGRFGTRSPDDRLFRPIVELRASSLLATPETFMGDSERPHIEYFFPAQHNFWALYVLEGQRESQSGLDPERGCEVLIGRDLPFSAKLLPSRLERFDQASGYMWTSRNHSLKLKLDGEAGEVSLKECMPYADAVSLAVSVATRTRTAWLRAHIGLRKEVSRFMVARLELEERGVSYAPWLIDVGSSLRMYLDTAVNRIREFSNQGIDLRVALESWHQARLQTNTTNQFLLLFVCLEKLKDLYARKAGLLQIQSDAEYIKLASAIDGVLGDCIAEPKIRRQVSSKLRELNRPTFRSVLQRMLDHYKVPWRDLYPPDAKLGFIRTRDTLLHSTDPVPPDRLYNDMERVQAIVDRLLLRLLGWDDLSATPSEYTLERLSKVHDNEAS